MCAGTCVAQNTININGTPYEVVNREFNHIWDMPDGNTVPFHINSITADGAFIDVTLDQPDLRAKWPIRQGNDPNQEPELVYYTNDGTTNFQHRYPEEGNSWSSTDILIPLRGVTHLTAYWEWVNPERTVQGLRQPARPQRIGFYFTATNNN